MPKRNVIRNFDDFMEEAKMLPDFNDPPVFAISNPLEQHFMNVADKHGVLDEILQDIDGIYED